MTIKMARIGEERGRGVPLSDVERVMRHYNIDEEEARRWLTIHPASELLPKRGIGLEALGFSPNPGLGFWVVVALGAYLLLRRRRKAA